MSDVSWHNITIYNSNSGYVLNSALLYDRFGFRIMRHSDSWKVYRYGGQTFKVQFEGTIKECVAWCEDYFKETFIETFRPEDSLPPRYPLYHDVFQTEFYTVLIDRLELVKWSFTVEERQTGKKIFTQTHHWRGGFINRETDERVGTHYVSYEAAVQGFAAWLWETHGKQIFAHDYEKRIEQLAQKIETESVYLSSLNEYVLESLDMRSVYTVKWMHVGDAWSGWKIVVKNEGIHHRLYHSKEEAFHTIARELVYEGREKEFGLT